MGRILGGRSDESRFEPLFANEDLVYASRVNRECDQSQLTRGHLGRHTSSVRLLTSRICVCRENDEMDRRLGSAEFDDLLEIGPFNLSRGRRAVIKTNF